MQIYKNDHLISAVLLSSYVMMSSDDKWIYGWNKNGDKKSNFAYNHVQAALTRKQQDTQCQYNVNDSSAMGHAGDPSLLTLLLFILLVDWCLWFLHIEIDIQFLRVLSH